MEPRTSNLILLAQHLLREYLRMQWTYWGVCGPGGKPLRLAVIGAGSYAQWIHDHIGLCMFQAPAVMHVIACGEAQPGILWEKKDPIPFDTLNEQDVDSLLLCPDEPGYKSRRLCRTLRPASKPCLEFDPIIRFCFRLPESPDMLLILCSRLLELYVQSIWLWLGRAGLNGTPLKVAVYGAGEHTHWLEATSGEVAQSGPHVVAILDDNRVSPNPMFWGMPVTATQDFNPVSADVILLSSDYHTEQMEQRCAALFGDRIPRLRLYEGLPTGPYPKR